MNHSANRFGVIVALVGAAATALVGCSSSNSTSDAPASSSTTAATPSSSASATTTSAVDAASRCTEDGLAAAATAAVQAVSKDNTYKIDDVKCSDGWAVTSGLWSGTSNPTVGAPSTLVFQQQGGQWVGQDKQAVCGTNPTATPAPADAKIPAALYELGCLTS